MFVSLVIIIVLCVLGGAVFVVQDVQVVIDSADDVGVSNEDIIKTASVTKGKSIFSISESKVVSNIEKSYPTLKVKGVERVFPNKIILKLAERVPIIAIKFEGKNEYLILDNNMCAIEKFKASPDDPYLKTLCVVSGFELSGPNDIYLGKQLPTSYGEQAVVCQHIMAGLEKKMGLKKMSEFLYGIEFSQSMKVVYAVTRYNNAKGVIIRIAYDNMKEDKQAVFNKIQKAYEYYLSIDNPELKKEGYIMMENGEFTHKLHE